MIDKQNQDTHHQTKTVRNGKDDRVIDLLDEALKWINSAKEAEKANKTEHLSGCTSEIISLLVKLNKSDHSQNYSDSSINLLSLYSYMIDRLSLNHSALQVPSLHEVEWLLKGLRDVFKKNYGLEN